MRHASWDGADVDDVGSLVRAYLLQTETEKVEHDTAESSSSMGMLPSGYEREVADPRSAYAECTTLIAEVDERAAGVAVVRITGGDAEIKRLWADPDVRGRGVGSALLDAALSLTDGSVRLSVWEWRTAAIRLYESRGFGRVASWDDRRGLVCMVRPSRSR